MATDFPQLFPKLGLGDYTLTSPKTPHYNCIAWAAGDEGRWWWPDSAGVSYWPIAERSETVGNFRQAFESLGFVQCGGDEIEDDFEKIALYAKDAVPTHMSRQLISGMWTSKCGRMEDISHQLGGLEGTDYGEIALIMKRQVGD